MHGREGCELKKLSRHMWSTKTTTTTIGGVVDSNGTSASCFFKDGRKINIGDCALFKPAEDSPPFVGIIHSWTSERESNLKLRVNWLYRPCEVKLLKGVALEAAPNEVLYSFHSDEIPAASLLHPCKVAFLPKGVELPPGISSFVCRRVYDITNKCLWWLTDQDYIDDRQEEVDQLLKKTRKEMHVSLEQQQDSRSPKQLNGSTPPPLKQSPDSVQNSTSNLSSHRKGKKRDRVDHSFDVSKRQRSSKPDDHPDPGQLKSEPSLNFEISKFCEKGGLVDYEGVLKLVRLMKPEKSEKKVDLTSRSMLTGVIALTDKCDCLHHFVDLRGLLVLNEWLQEVHKGKIGNSGNSKTSDKSVDDFLLVLLRALDKLPVNLTALQMCNIGKSVNHLRSHKNPEIQKKARSLVDTWKKRVEAEMNIVENGSNRHPIGSDSAIRSTITHHSSLKCLPVKNETCKDVQSRVIVNGGNSDPQKDEKSSSSSQSHTNSQCSSEQVRHVIPCKKEDTRKSTAGSKSLTRSVGNTTHRKSRNGTKSSSQIGIDSSVQESNNNHKIIVKIGNRGRGQTQGGVIGSRLNDFSCRNSRDSSLSLLEKHDHSDKYDSQQFPDVDGSIHEKTSENKRLLDVSNISCSPSRTKIKSIKACDSSFNPMNALIESCAKICEAKASVVDGDDVGMNLLASVATREISKSKSKSGTISPALSPQRSSKMAENSSSDNGTDCKKLVGDDVIQQGQGQGRSCDISDADNHIKNEDISKIDGGIGKMNGIKGENLRQNVEQNGTLVEKEGQNELPFDAQDKAKGISVKDDIESKVKKENETCPIFDDDDKKDVNPVPHRDDVFDQNAPVESNCDPMNTTDATSQHLTTEKSNEVKSEPIDAVSGKRMLERETCPEDEKQDESDRRCTDAEQNGSFESQNIKNNESSGQSLQTNCEDSHLTVEKVKSPAIEEEKKEKSGSIKENVATSPSSGGQDLESKLGFDLNEGFDLDEGKSTDPLSSTTVTIAAPAKGLTVLPDNLLRNKREIGWKGSAKTSAFRPTEPRKSMEVPVGPTKSSRVPLDIDLNVADESSVHESPLCNLGGFDLDLNKVDEAPNAFSNFGVGGKRDFDLNDGPSVEDMPVDQIPCSQPNRAHVPFQYPLGSRVNTSDIGNCFPWYPSLVGIGGGGPHRVIGGPNAPLSSSPDTYRGSALSCSPTLPFHSTPFQYPVLPFGSSFPLPTSALGGGPSGYVDPTTSSRISTIPSQLVGNGPPVSFQYPHPYVVSRSLTDVPNPGLVENSLKWGKKSLDLNSGPGTLNMEGRNDSLPIVSRQVSTIGTQSLLDEQGRMYSMNGGHLKRKEPEGGWNIDKFNFNQSSWR